MHKRDLPTKLEFEVFEAAHRSIDPDRVLVVSSVHGDRVTAAVQNANRDNLPRRSRPIARLSIDSLAHGYKHVPTVSTYWARHELGIASVAEIERLCECNEIESYRVNGTWRITTRAIDRRRTAARTIPMEFGKRRNVPPVKTADAAPQSSAALCWITSWWRGLVNLFGQR